MFEYMKKCLLVVLLVAAIGCFADDYVFEEEGPPFQKIYITYADLVTTPDGVFYFNKEGYPSFVKLVYHDWDGMYIMIVNK